MRGRFIAVDGPDKTGKTTLVSQLANWLEDIGKEAFTFHAPSSSEIGKMTQRVIDDPKTTQMEKMLMAQVNVAALSEATRLLLRDGAWIIGDRYILSNIAFNVIPLIELHEGRLRKQHILSSSHGFGLIEQPDLCLLLLPFEQYERESINQLDDTPFTEQLHRFSESAKYAEFLVKILTWNPDEETPLNLAKAAISEHFNLPS